MTIPPRASSVEITCCEVNAACGTKKNCRGIFHSVPGVRYTLYCHHLRSNSKHVCMCVCISRNKHEHVVETPAEL